VIKSNLETAPAMENPLGLDARIVAEGPAATLMRVKLPPGGRVPLHPAHMVVDFIVLDGEGVAIDGEERIAVRRGDTVRFEPGSPHGFDASPGLGLELLAVKHEGDGG